MYKTRKFKQAKPAHRRRHSHKKPSAQGKMDIHKYIKELKVQLEEPYDHTHTFRDFNLKDQLLNNISSSGYVMPTEIQDKSIPFSLKGQDVVGIAGTGTGKTAAFLIPIINRLIENPRNQSSLIIAPTRELATQIFDEFRKLSKGCKLFATTLIGGTSVSASIKMLRKTNHIIIGTPGRLMDMANRGFITFSAFSTLVLDEFDRMLDMGFSEDIKAINKEMVSKEQTLLFSATMERSQRRLVDEMTNHPLEVTAGIGTQNTHAIEQEVINITRDKNKMEVLQDLISVQEGKKILLFCETKRRVDQVHKSLKQANIKSDLIHGDKTQKAREAALNKFKKGVVNVLVATDVVARGIDVTDISMVINDEVPQNYNDYIHRIGRTGRAGKTGKAVTLVER